MSDHPDYTGRTIRRPMARCVECRSWWTIAEDDPNPRCPCGGSLAIVDMEKHVKSLPNYKPYLPPNGKNGA